MPLVVHLVFTREDHYITIIKLVILREFQSEGVEILYTLVKDWDRLV